MSGPSNKAERLALAGQIAPVLRDQTPGAIARRVARVDSNGNVVGYTTIGEVQASLLRRQKIELAFEEGVRPTEVPCERCGAPVAVRPTGRIPKVHAACKIGHCSICLAETSRGKSRCGTCVARIRDRLCVGCANPLGRDAATRCRPCSDAFQKAAAERRRPKCIACGASTGRQANSPARRKLRNNSEPICRDCNVKRLAGRTTVPGLYRTDTSQADVADDTDTRNAEKTQ